MRHTIARQVPRTATVALLLAGLLSWAPTASLLAEEFHQSHRNVEVYSTYKYGSVGYDYGVEYEARNTNGFAVCITLWVNDGYCCTSGLIGEYPPLLLHPGKEGYPGWVVQAEASQEDN